ncbi:hypothetical protein ACIBL6_18170 [Streptomyces sp. NPDC050400]|uniref:hypothetical protein n=1 Tax=Streptomyces sp. NPDC050400 TaxID=3365610 RepID=UPI0037B9F5B6
MADEVEPGELGEHAQPSTTFGEGKPIWYLVPLRMLCTIAFFMTLSSCIVAYGGVMNDARWGTATLIALCVAVGTGVCRRTAKARFDRRSR